MAPAQKHTNAKAILLAILVVAGMIVSPVSAIYTTTGTLILSTEEQRLN